MTTPTQNQAGERTQEEDGTETHFMPNRTEEEQRTQHTPGPWRVRQSLKHRSTAQHEASWETVISDRQSNRILAKITEAPLGDESTGVANARLIAAAPELLEACEEAAQQLEDLTPVYLNWHLYTGEIARHLRASIAKAKGKP